MSNLRIYFYWYKLRIVIKYKVLSAQPSISQNAILELEFPLPPLLKQQEIVNHITQLKNQIQKAKEQSNQLKTQAQEEFERAIFKN